MEQLTTAEAMSAWSDARRGRSRIGLVPTMGYLHAGHTSLMDALRPHCDQLVVSIYVNPTQFGPDEDLDRYPRDLPGDLATCEAHGVDAVFVPDTLYPPRFATRVRVEGLTDGLCGAHRPVHFEGVTTVVARLFGVTRCDVAVFGEKDFQQLRVLQRMAADLGWPVEVRGAPIVREPDGLALSSRNAYLGADARRRALSLSRALRAMASAVDAGESTVSKAATPTAPASTRAVGCSRSCARAASSPSRQIRALHAGAVPKSKISWWARRSPSCAWTSTMTPTSWRSA